MKNLSLILNAVLFAAVVVLYVLFFTGNKTTSVAAKTTNKDTAGLAMANGGIVYIDIDTVLQKYDMYTDITGDLQEKLKTSEAQLASKQESFRKEAEDFQYKIDRGLITRSEAAELQQQLQQKEQSLYQLQNNLQLQLSEEEQVAHRKVLNSIMEYLDELEKTGVYQYQFVLGATFGGNVLYANENMNITQAVIEGLNENYKKSLQQKEKK